ncbi:MAG: HAD-IIB family hydrolase [Endomicrobium sp.]|nr:HAD-IIB family hydrolase [Endomicrobium sp.]
MPIYDIYLFDMDGTLTPARLPMTESFAVWFREFIRKNDVYIVSGSDIDKIKSQIPSDIFNNVAGIYASMGNEFYKNGAPGYERKFEPPQKLLIMLEKYRENTKYTGKLFPNYIEMRKGMVNFSVLGRDCPYEERIKYKEWDNKNAERISIQKELSAIFNDLDISIGGNISMDIVPKGFGKEQVAALLRNKFPNSKIIFTGDKTQKGGNDYSLAQALLACGNSEIVQVDSPDDVINKFKSRTIDF